MNTFGSWLKQLRLDKGQDLRTVAYKSDVHFTTIGRIEKGMNDPILDTAIKITMALDGDPADLYHHLTGRTPLLPLPSDISNPRFPTAEDVIAFEKLVNIKPKTAGKYIANLLNSLIPPTETDPHGNFEMLKSYLSEEGNEEIKWLYQSTYPNFYTALDVIKFLIRYPSIHGELIISKTLCQYPDDMDNKMILEAYKQNGVMILADLLNYISYFYDNLSPDKYSTSNEAAKTLFRTSQIIDKLTNNVQFLGLKLGDIITIDQTLGEQHEIFMMAWSAAKEEVRQIQSLNLYGAGMLLITISRFLAIYDKPEQNWLLDLRNLK